jgi:hypothetical protein
MKSFSAALAMVTALLVTQTGRAGPIHTLDLHLGSQGVISYDGTPTGALIGAGLNVISYDTGPGSATVVPVGWTVDFQTGPVNPASPGGQSFMPGGHLTVKDASASPLFEGVFRSKAFVEAVGDGFVIVGVGFRGVFDQAVGDFGAGEAATGAFSANFRTPDDIMGPFTSSSIGSGDIQAVTSTPEPSTVMSAVLGLTLLGLGYMRRRGRD